MYNCFYGYEYDVWLFCAMTCPCCEIVKKGEFSCMKKYIIITLTIITATILFGYLYSYSQKERVTDTIEKTSDEHIEEFLENGKEVISTTYYEMSDGTWKTDTHSYQYYLELVGTPNNAVEAITYIVLSNRKDITFEQVWRACFSSDSSDLISQDEVDVVGFKLG